LENWFNRQIVTYSRTIWRETYPILPVLEEEAIYSTRDGVNGPHPAAL